VIGKDWAKVFDSYGLDHLAEHLFRARQFSSLHDLINQEWLSIRTHNRKNYRGFIGDINLAWQATIQDNNLNTALDIRYSLILSSIQALAENIPPRLFPFLVQHGIWDFDQSMTFGSRVLRDRSRVDALLSLLTVVSLSEGDTRQILAELMNTELEIRAFMMSYYLVEEVAPYIPADMLLEFLDSLSRIKSNTIKQSLTSALLPYLPTEVRDDVLKDLLALTHSLSTPKERAEALTNLGSSLSIELIKETLSEIALVEPGDRSQALRRIASFIPTDLIDQYMELLKETNPVTTDMVDTIYHLATDPSRLVAVRAESTVHSKKERGYIPSEHRITPDIQKRLIDEAVRIADAEKDPTARIIALGIISPSKPELQDQICLPLLSVMLSRVGYNHSITSFENLVSCLRPGSINNILDRLDDFSADAYQVSRVIDALSPYLDEQQTMRALDIVDKTLDRKNKITCITYLIPNLVDNLSAKWTERAYQLAIEVDDSHTRDNAIFQLVGQQTEPVIAGNVINNTDVRMFSAQIRELLMRNFGFGAGFVTWDIVQAVSKFAGIIEPAELAEIGKVVIKNNHELNHPFNAAVIGYIFPYLPHDSWQEMLTFLLEHIHCFCYRYTLCDLMPKLTDEQLVYLLRGIGSLPNSENLILVQTALLAYLPAETWHFVQHISKTKAVWDQEGWQLGVYKKPQVDSALQKIGTGSSEVRSNALISWTPFLPEDSYEDAVNANLQAADRSISRTWGPNHAEYLIHRMLRFLPPRFFPRIVNFQVDELWGQQNSEQGMIEAMKILSNRVLELDDYQTVRLIWHQTVRALSAQTRRNLLVVLPSLRVFIEKLGGESAINATVDQVLDITSWWN